MIENKKPGFSYGYVIVIAAFIIVAFVMGEYNSFGIFFEPVLDEFGWTRAMTSGAFSLCTLLIGFLGIAAGRLSDRFGPRLVVMVGGFLIGLGYLLMSQINAIWQLYLFYGVIISFGVSGGFIPALSTTARWFAKRRSTMTGIVMTGTGMGMIVISQLANWLISSHGWRTSFIAIGISTLVLVISAGQFLRRDPQSFGQLSNSVTGKKQEGSKVEAGGLFLQEALRTQQLWLLWSSFFLLGISMFGITVHIVIHTTGLGFTASQAANILTIMGGLNIASRLVMGGAADKIGIRPSFTIGISLMAIALFWLLIAKDLWMIYLFAALFGFAWGAAAVQMSPLVAELFGLRSHGVLFGIINAGFTTGGTVGPVLIGHIYDITDSYQLGFLASGGIAVMSLLLSLLLHRTGNRDWRRWLKLKGSHQDAD